MTTANFEINPKSEEIVNFYLAFLKFQCIFRENRNILTNFVCTDSTVIQKNPQY